MGGLGRLLHIRSTQIQPINCQTGPVTVNARPGGLGGLYIVASIASELPADEAVGQLYAAAGRLMNEHHLLPVHDRLFGRLSQMGDWQSARRQALGPAAEDQPVTALEQPPAVTQHVAGLQLWALPHSSGVNTIRHAGQAVGRVWKVGDGRMVVLQDIQAPDASAAPAEQAHELFTRAQELLGSLGMAYANVARTWIYLRDILSWYSDFNRVRNAAYNSFGLGHSPDTPLRLPASTGISAGNARGSAAAMDLLAVENLEVSQMSSQAQQDAFAYGSAFSRAARVELPDATMVQLSGTAAIDETGQSLAPGDAAAQTAITIDKVRSLLHQAGVEPTHVTSATAFVKRPEDVQVCRRVLADALGKDFPAVWTIADVCRDELLFEIDAVAVRS
jgi:enamine deaminase RidA (YjgF/YER057c/UK114 family)